MISGDTQPLAFSLKHAADLAECSTGLLRKMIRTGRLKAVRLGNRWRVPRTEMLRVCGENTARRGILVTNESRKQLGEGSLRLTSERSQEKRRRKKG